VSAAFLPPAATALDVADRIDGVRRDRRQYDAAPVLGVRWAQVRSGPIRRRRHLSIRRLCRDAGLRVGVQPVEQTHDDDIQRTMGIRSIELDSSSRALWALY